MPKCLKHEMCYICFFSTQLSEYINLRIAPWKKVQFEFRKDEDRVSSRKVCKPLFTHQQLTSIVSRVLLRTAYISQQ